MPWRKHTRTTLRWAAHFQRVPAALRRGTLHGCSMAHGARAAEAVTLHSVHGRRIFRSSSRGEDGGVAADGVVLTLRGTGRVRRGHGGHRIHRFAHRLGSAKLRVHATYGLLPGKNTQNQHRDSLGNSMHLKFDHNLI